MSICPGPTPDLLADFAAAPRDEGHLVKPVTLDDVARRVGVSRQTVSRVINGKAGVRDDTRARIEAAIAELGYRPNFFARGLVTRRSSAVGLVVGDITNPFFPDIARGVQDMAEQHGYNVFVCNFGGDNADELNALGALATQGADGCIFFSAGERPKEVLRFAETYGPLVAVNADYDHPNISLVQADLRGGGRLAAEHLIANGRRKLAVIGASYLPAGEPRIVGFRERAEQLGHAVADEATVLAPASASGGQLGVTMLIDRGVDFDAIFAFNDMVAIGALRTLGERGIRVPDRCALVGCDDLDLAKLVSPTLTSIQMDRYQLGRTAMRVLLDRLNAPTEHVSAVLTPTSIVARESTRAVDHG